MRAIIIDDKDARALLDELKLEGFEAILSGRTAAMLQERFGMRGEDLRFLVDEIHGRFHYRVCRWLQDQGANVIR